MQPEQNFYIKLKRNYEFHFVKTIKVSNQMKNKISVL